jgi:hypothetical protein
MTPEDRTIVEARKTLAHAYRHRQPERSGRVFRACRVHAQLMATLTRNSPVWKLLMLPKVPEWKRIVGRTWR